MKQVRLIILMISSGLMILSCSKLAEDTESSKPVIVWQQSDSGYALYRIPSIIVTQKGTVLAFAEARQGQEDSGDIDLVVKRSMDNGKSWGEQSVVWSDGRNTCGNPCPVIDQTTGRIILMMTWNLGGEDEGDIIMHDVENTRRPYMSYSDDDGLIWSEPVDLTETCKKPDWGWYATGPGVAIQLKSEKYKNRLVIPANHSYTTNNKEEQVTEGGYGYGSHVLLSDDGGANWRMSTMITPGCNESQVVELSDGRLMMNMRSYNRMGCRAISISEDGGETWSKIEHALQLVEEVCQASFIEYGLYGGEKMYLFSNPGNPVDRYFMTIKTSFDDCETWSNDKLIFAGPSAYSCMTVSPNGNIGLLFEGGREYRYESIVFVSIHPDQLFQPGVLLGSNQLP